MTKLNDVIEKLDGCIDRLQPVLIKRVEELENENKTYKLDEKGGDISKNGMSNTFMRGISKKITPIACQSHINLQKIRTLNVNCVA